MNAFILISEDCQRVVVQEHHHFSDSNDHWHKSYCGQPSLSDAILNGWMERYEFLNNTIVLVAIYERNCTV